MGYFKHGEYTYGVNGIEKVEPVDYRLTFVKTGVCHKIAEFLRSVNRHVAESYSVVIKGDKEIHVGYLVKVWSEKKDRYYNYFIRSVSDYHLHHIYNGYPMSRLIYDKIINDFKFYTIVYVTDNEVYVSKPAHWKLQSHYVSNSAEGQQVLPLNKWWKCSSNKGGNNEGHGH